MILEIQFCESWEDKDKGSQYKETDWFTEKDSRLIWKPKNFAYHPQNQFPLSDQFQRLQPLLEELTEPDEGCWKLHIQMSPKDHEGSVFGYRANINWRLRNPEDDV